jgi:hypothetical protein
MVPKRIYSDKMENKQQVSWIKQRKHVLINSLLIFFFIKCLRLCQHSPISRSFKFSSIRIGKYRNNCVLNDTNECEIIICEHYPLNRLRRSTARAENERLSTLWSRFWATRPLWQISLLCFLYSVTLTFDSTWPHLST